MPGQLDAAVALELLERAAGPQHHVRDDALAALRVGLSSHDHVGHFSRALDHAADFFRAHSVSQRLDETITPAHVVEESRVVLPDEVPREHDPLSH